MIVQYLVLYVGAEKCYSLQTISSEPRDILAISKANVETHQSRGIASLFSSKMITMVLLWAVCGSVFAMPKETLKSFSGLNSSQTLPLSLSDIRPTFGNKRKPKTNRRNLSLKAKIPICFRTSTLRKVCIAGTMIFFPHLAPLIYFTWRKKGKGINIQQNWMWTVILNNVKCLN